MNTFSKNFVMLGASLGMVLLGILSADTSVHALDERAWRDKSGNYQVTATLVGHNDELAILKKPDGEMVAFPITDLSTSDREYLDSNDAKKIAHSRKSQTWTFRDGRQVAGEVVSHGDKEVVIQSRRGKIFVNDRAFENLPEVYQEIVPLMVAHFENRRFGDVGEFKRFVERRGSRPLKYKCEGVILELENGDEYGVPYFLFSDDDRKFLEAGRDDYRREETTDEERENHALYTRSLAHEYQQNRVAEQQIQRLQLGLLATTAGVTDMWEVAMIPPNGNFYFAQSVVVFARDSRQASILASQQWPGYTVGPVRRVNRNW
ncbi:MAG: hypothetical protein KF851_02945 [Pirellulaceae bacterium]|jgi:hypothetical protein|nr:hypothetical protein [Pirellulaceae bacterium]